MNSFRLWLPTWIVFGAGESAQTGELCRQFGAKRVLLHYGSTYARSSGLLDETKKLLNLAGMTVFELGGVKPNPRIELVRVGIEICRRENIDFIVALGGGSVIDSAKAIALGTFYDGDVWDYFAGRQDTVGSVLPIGAVCTLPASSSENNCTCVLSNEKDEQKYPIHLEQLFPRFAILDPELTYSLPTAQTAAGAADTIAHVLSFYFAKQRDNDVIYGQIEAVIRSVIKNSVIALKKPDDYEARAQLMWCAAIGYNESLAAGCVQDWATHTIEHELGAMYDITHGAGLAVLMPAWMRFFRKEGVNRLCRFAHNVFGVPYDFSDPQKMAEEGIVRFEKYLSGMGLPTRLHELNIDDTRFAEIAARISARQPVYGSIKKITAKETEKILRLCM